MSISQSEVYTQVRPWVVGQLVGPVDPAKIPTIINNDPEAAQSSTLEVTGATGAGTVYSATFQLDIGAPITVSVTNPGGTSLDDMAELLKQAIEADGMLNGAFKITRASATLSLTFYLGRTGTVTATTNATYLLVSAAADASPVQFGRAVIRNGFASQPSQNGVGGLPSVNSFTAQVDTWTIVFSSGETADISITVGGQTYSASAVHATSLTVTLDAIALAINNVLPANTVLAANSGGTALTLTAEIAGLAFESSLAQGPSSAVAAPSLSSNKGFSTDALARLIGVALNSYATAATTVGSPEGEYPANQTMRVLQYGSSVAVLNDESPVPGDSLYLELAATTDRGKFYKTASATRILIPSSRARWEALSSAKTGTTNLASIEWLA